MRLHGFEKPFDPYQMLSWVLFSMVLLGFYLVQAPALLALGRPVAIFIDILYTSIALLVLVAAYFCTKTDSSDPNLLAKLAAEKKKGAQAFATESVPGKNYCYICQIHVNKKSKHCRLCDKCVDVFDHHCKWLNNCIGLANYRVFLVLLVSTFALVTLELSLTVWLLSTLHDPETLVLDTIIAVYGPVHWGVCMALAMLVGLVCMPVWGLLGQLLFFHIGLVHKQMTTYEYIVSAKAKQERKADDGGAAVHFSAAQLSKKIRAITRPRNKIDNFDQSDGSSFIDRKKAGKDKEGTATSSTTAPAYPTDGHPQTPRESGEPMVGEEIKPKPRDKTTDKIAEASLERPSPPLSDALHPSPEPPSAPSHLYAMPGTSPDDLERGRAEELSPPHPMKPLLESPRRTDTIPQPKLPATPLTTPLTTPGVLDLRPDTPPATPSNRRATALAPLEGSLERLQRLPPPSSQELPKYDVLGGMNGAPLPGSDSFLARDTSRSSRASISELRFEVEEYPTQL